MKKFILFAVLVASWAGLCLAQSNSQMPNAGNGSFGNPSYGNDVNEAGRGDSNE